MIVGVLAGAAMIAQEPPGPVLRDSLLLSSMDELEVPALLLLSGDMQSGTDALDLSGDADG